MTIKPAQFALEAKKNEYFKIEDILADGAYQIPAADIETLSKIDIVYRALVAVLYNYAPLSGHPGGSISSGRLVSNLIYNIMDYDFANPDDISADMLSYAAGHKALGLYALSALRDEIVSAYRPQLLASLQRRLRLEDLLGFRKSNQTATKIFKEFESKSLDGHPVPITPFVKLSTGASGIGFGSSIGLALGAADIFGQNAPKVNIIEGEGGLTAGRCSEAMAIASDAGLDNAIVHLDWNQASIDSDKVTAENGVKGDYVSWTPAELMYINGFNIIQVNDGFDFKQVYAAQKFAYGLNNGCPTAIVYRTVKGWHYGIEGKASHGSGHKFASDGYYNALAELESNFAVEMPRFCGVNTPDAVEECYWNTLLAIRGIIEKHPEIFAPAAAKIEASAARLKNDKRTAAHHKTQDVYTRFTPDSAPSQFKYAPDANPALRTAMAEALGYINKETQGSMIVATADLSGSTGAGAIAKDFPKGYFNKETNPQSRLMASGGICEDGISAVLSGVSAYGQSIGIAASYAAFSAAMMHTAARLHAIGQQAYTEATGRPANTFVVFNGHAGLPTGEDGPTHGDPQALQLILNDFPKGSAITLTPLDGNDVWPSLAAALNKRPAVLYPVVTRPNVTIVNRAALGGDDAKNAKNGVYRLSKSAKTVADGVIIVQGSGAGEIFANKVLPQLKQEGIEIDSYYVSSLELFDMLTPEEQNGILPFEDLQKAIAITDFTLPTVQCWLKSENGAKFSIYPFKGGKYMTSGKAADVYKEAGMDADGQIGQIKTYIAELKKGGWR